jgi:hypothetical protein
MKIHQVEPPRAFSVGRAGRTLHEVARIELAANEQVTLLTEDLREYDVVATDFGFYATPSLNRRLPAQGLRPGLIRSAEMRFYVVLVRSNRFSEFQAYCRSEGEELVCWLDDPAVLASFAQAATPPIGDA